MALASIQRIEMVSPIEGADRIEKVTMEGLATVQKIYGIRPIPGADKIEAAKILGWDVVVRKGEFKDGDLVIFITIDTIIPVTLLSGDWNNTEVVRLRTVKMKKQVSQGLVLPINTLEHYVSHLDIFSDHVEFTDGTGEWKTLGIGIDISEPMKIKKYEKVIPAEMQGLAKGNFPSFIPKTDEVRLQAEPELLEILKTKKGIYATLKIDGTSSTNYKHDNEFGVCSRNLDLERGGSIYWQMVEKLRIEENLPEMYAIQGEIFGPKFSKNPLGISDYQFNVFNMWQLVGNGPSIRIPFPSNKYLSEEMGLSFVPVIIVVESFDQLPFHDVDSALAYVETLHYANGHLAEGMVVRSFDQEVSFKVVSNTYLLKHEE